MKLEFRKFLQCLKNLTHVPEIGVTLDGHLMFRCPEGCDQNSDIQFASHELTGDDSCNSELRFNIQCPKCNAARSVGIAFAPHTAHTDWQSTWAELKTYWDEVCAPFRKADNEGQKP